MKRIKSAEKLGQERGYQDMTQQYVAAYAVLSVKLEFVLADIDRLKSIPEECRNQTDYEHCLSSIESCLKDLVEGGV